MSDDTRQQPSRLVVSPTAGFQNDVVSLTLSAEGIQLNTCPGGDLEFTNEAGENPFTVHGIDALLHEEGSVRAYVTIAKNAAPGPYTVLFKCNAETELKGGFRVNEVPSEIELTIDSPTASAGVPHKELVLTTELPFFSEDSYVLFGDGVGVTVTEQQLLNEGDTELLVTVRISPYTPTGEMNVTAITGNRIARGVLIITERVKSEIFVLPDEVERQAYDPEKPSVAELTIWGKGIEFIEPSPDAGADDEATQISFPEEPGITVLGFSVIESVRVEGNDPLVTTPEKQIIAQVLVSELAKLGGTTLQVTTGETSAWTNLTIQLPPGTPYLKIKNESPIPRNGKPTLVFAEAINFTFEDVESVECIEEYCTAAQNYTVGPEYKRMDIEVTVAPEFSANYATLEVVTADGSAKARIDIGSKQAVVLEVEPESLTQGTTEADISFTLSDESSFEDSTAVHVLPRSGLEITEPLFSSDNSKMEVSFTVASDAPTGPAYVLVESGNNVYVTPLYIAPSGYTPYITIFPGATLKKRDLVLLDVHAEGLTLPLDKNRYQFDDPALSVLQVKSDGEDVKVTVEVSPKARTDMSVLYVNADNGKAATTFRVLKSTPMKILQADPEIVDRGQTTTIQVSDPDITFNMPTVEEVENLGIEVWKYQGGENLVFDLNAEEDGAGGWTGLVVHNEAESYLVKVHIEGTPNSLTAQLSPGTVYPGTRTEPVTAIVPPQLILSPSMLTVQSGAADVFASNPTIEDGKVHFILDVPLDVATDQNPIPIFITGAQGAAVGLLNIKEITPLDVWEGKPWTGNPVGNKTILNVDPGQAPTLVTGSIGRPELAEPTTTLIADNQLDESDSTSNGLLWITERQDEDEVAAVEVESRDGTRNVQVDVRARGRAAERESDETENDNGIDWIAEAPCTDPFLGVGIIANSLDRDRILIEETDCRLAVIVLARQLANRPWDTPDLKIERLDAGGQSIDVNTGWPTARYPDPLLFIDAGLTDVELSITSELGSTGSYLIHIRRPAIIRELGLSPGASFIELGVEANASLDGLRLELVDAEDGIVQESLLLGAIPSSETGIVLISGSDYPVGVLPDTGAFAVRLYDGETLVDAVQVGEGTASFGEGLPVLMMEDATVVFRVANVDTNDNLEDFKIGFVGTPGA